MILARTQSRTVTAVQKASDVDRHGSAASGRVVSADVYADITLYRSGGDFATGVCGGVDVDADVAAPAIDGRCARAA